MANHERGVYEPSNDVRVFDGSEEQEDVEGSRLPLLIVLALLVLGMFAGVVWLAYTQGVARGRGQTPILTAAAGPERVAPPEGSSNSVPYQGFKIYEQPAPSDDNADAGAAPAMPTAAPAAKRPPAALGKPASRAAAPTKPVPAKPAPASAPPAKSVAALIQQANAVPVDNRGGVPSGSASQLPPSAAAKPARTAQTQPGASGAPRALTAIGPTAAPLAAKAVAPAASGGGYVLQIGAYKSQADAAAAWKAYSRRHATLVAGYAEQIQQVNLGEKGLWFRLRLGGLSDKEVATALCDRLKADGGACILGR